MTVVPGYQAAGGWYWETACLRNMLAHRGVAHSEALLLGLSGGIGVMYFVFEYEGWEPRFFVNTRQVRPKGDALADLCRRLGVKVAAAQTPHPQKAEASLVGQVEAGRPVMVWADRESLPYNLGRPTPGVGYMLPIVVFGVEGEQVLIEDRSALPLTCSLAELAAARANYASVKNRALVVEGVDTVDLPAAVLDAIRDCAAGFVAGPMANFGLKGLLKWADLLVSARDKKGWPTLFGTGERFYKALVSSFAYIELEGTGGGATRPLYASFLDEAAVLLGRPALREVADQFRDCGRRWTALADAFLGPFPETRDSLRLDDRLFREQGMASVGERRMIGERLASFGPERLPEVAVALRQELHDRLVEIHAAEAAAVGALQEAVS
ncbi:MAG TPA: DUF4872 domain-containing protein [Symbiobacteriaceae bacterium]|nr:DUF4872 domain-containing protein [Symbiobacteriaceae bacterium]